MKETKYHIAIAGNIGAGKSTLAEMLGSHFGWQVAYEAVDDNPYLEDYYKNMPRWAFHVQVCFLNSRFEQLKEIQKSESSIIQDRSIYEDAYVFAKSLYHQKLLSDRDYHCYQRLFHSMMDYVKPPDLLIYLQSSMENLQVNIQKRARGYEADISTAYLTDLNLHYENWLSAYDLGKILRVNLNEMDFVNHPHDFEQIITQVKAQITHLPFT